MAVIDTGGLDHPDMEGRLVGGHDLISDDESARRPPGTGRVPDGTDRGDWWEEDGELWWPSSWHGTHVAGTIGASTDNNRGVAGVDQRARIQHVRVLGAMGGSPFDVADGMRWAVGDAVEDTQPNANPAQVLNLSLGGMGTCMSSSRQAIEAARAADAVVVVAAGNSWSDLHDLPGDPATCPGVVNVAATGPTGARAFYSDYGWPVDLAAPGGAGGGPGVDVLSTLNPGQTVAELDANGRPVDHYDWAAGTSMAAPHVAGIVSLMRAANPDLTERQLRAVITDPANVQAFDALPQAPPPGAMACSADPFVPAEQGAYCGSGIADAGRAVAAAQDTPAIVTIDGASAVAADTRTDWQLGVGNVTDTALSDLELRLLGAGDRAATLPVEVHIDGFAVTTHDLPFGASVPGEPVRLALPELEPGSEVEVRMRTELPAGRYQLIAELWSSDGSLAMPEPAPAAGLPDADRSSVNVDRTTLPADPDHPAQVTVQVRDASDAPVADAHVQVVARAGVSDGSADGAQGRTDEDGITVLMLGHGVAGTQDYEVTADGVVIGRLTLVFHALPAALEVRTEPTSGPVDEPLDPAVEVAWVDAAGELIEDLHGPRVQVQLLGSGDGVLQGVTEVDTQGGIARFDDLQVTEAGSAYRLWFETMFLDGELSVRSEAFDRTGAGPERLRLRNQPQDARVGRALDPAIEVALVDRDDQPVSLGDGATVEVELLGAGSDQLTGSTAAELDNGVASFGDLVVERAAQNLRLEFRVEVDDVRYSVVSEPFSVDVPQPLVPLVHRQPTDTTVGEPFTPPVVVEVLDEDGHRLQGPGVSSPPVRVRLVTTDEDELGLDGEQQAEVVDGLATFDGLAPAEPGRDLRLMFTLDIDLGAISVLSEPFTVEGRSQPAGPVPTFSDVPPDSVHAANIAAVAAAGITQGCGDDRFCPGDPVSRGQMATFLSRALGLEDPGGVAFPDVDAASTHAPGIRAVVDAGIAGGYVDGRFGPADPVTRAQMATFLRNAASLTAEVPAADFSDRDRIPAVHLPSVDAVAHAGIAGGYVDGRYGPGDPVTRAQMATFLARAFLSGDGSSSPSARTASTSLTPIVRSSTRTTTHEVAGRLAP